LFAACHRDSKFADFSSPFCSPTGEAGKNVQSVFWVICGQPQAFYRDLSLILRGKRIKFLFMYIVNVNKCECFKNRSFLIRDDQKILKYGSGSY
jgi:hypothetical protein